MEYGVARNTTTTTVNRSVDHHQPVVTRRTKDVELHAMKCQVIDAIKSWLGVVHKNLAKGKVEATFTDVNDSESVHQHLEFILNSRLSLGIYRWTSKN